MFHLDRILLLWTLLLTLQPVASADQILLGLGTAPGDGSSNLYRIDQHQVAPVAVDLGETGRWMCDLAVDPTTGRLYAIDCEPSGQSTSLYEIDRSDGSATLIGSLGAPFQNSLEFDLGGQLFSMGTSTGAQLYRVDKATGLASLVGFTGFAAGGDLAFDLDGKLYATSLTALYEIDLVTGAGRWIGMLGIGGAFGLDVDLDGTLYLLSEQPGAESRLYRVDKQGGLASLVGAVLGSAPLGAAGLSFVNATGVTYEFEVQDSVLSLTWLEGPAGQDAAGKFVLEGGAPFESVALIFGLQRASIPIGDVTLRIDPSGLLLLPVALDVQGRAEVQANLALLQNFGQLSEVLFQMISNLSRAEHASRLAVVRNL